jgi:hypothetical protein
MRHLIAAILLGTTSLFATTAPSAAEQRITGVVELFTSQGCSSCPPADAILAKLKREPGILVLAWHVDYWDYLGWKDTLGVEGATERQRLYAANFKSASVYTPQAVVNGATGLVGSRETQLRSALQNIPFEGIAIGLKRGPDGLVIALPQSDFNGVQTIIELVRFIPQAVVEVERGENAGESVIYENAVSKVTQLGVWNGDEKTVDAPSAGDGQGSAVLIRTVLSNGRAGPVIGAAVLGSS